MDVELVPAEITYGLDRLAMAVQGKRSAFELEWAPGVTWGEIFKENEREWSIYNFEEAPVDILLRRFDEYESECRHLLARRLPLPAYDQVLKLSHTFNLLDARGAIGVTERAATDRRASGPRARDGSALPGAGGRSRCRASCLRSAARSCPHPRATRPSASSPASAPSTSGGACGALHRPAAAGKLLRDLPERDRSAVWIKGPPEQMRERAAAGFARRHGVDPAGSR